MKRQGMVVQAPVFALHGFTGSPESFDVLSSGCCDAMTWLRPPLAGHGPTPDCSARDFYEEVDRLASWLRRASAEPVALLGYSMGARVGLALCARHPGLVERALFVGVHPGIAEEARGERIRWEQTWIRLLEQEGLVAFLREWERLPLFATQSAIDSAQAARQRDIRSQHRPEGLAHALRVLGTGSMPSLWPALPALQIPMTLMVGDQDDKFLDLAQKAVSRLARGRLQIIPNAGHNVLLERPSALQSWLEETS